MARERPVSGRKTRGESKLALSSRALCKTGAVLPHGSLIPNHAAKAMISDFLDEARRHQAALDASMADEVKGAP